MDHNRKYSSATQEQDPQRQTGQNPEIENANYLHFFTSLDNAIDL